MTRQSFLGDTLLPSFVSFPNIYLLLIKCKLFLKSILSPIVCIGGR